MSSLDTCVPPSPRCRPRYPKETDPTTQRWGSLGLPSPGSAPQVTSAGSPGHDLHPPGGGGQHPTPLPCSGPAAPAPGRTRGAQPQDLHLRVNPLLQSPRLNPCPPPAGSRSACTSTSPRKTPALLPPPFPALGAEVSPPPLGAGERQLEEELGEEGEDEPE